MPRHGRPVDAWLHPGVQNQGKQPETEALERMGFDAAYLRDRARNLRRLAEAARNEPRLRYLIDLAEDFEEEARRREQEGAS